MQGRNNVKFKNIALRFEGGRNKMAAHKLFS
jgi:hypothetical protein